MKILFTAICCAAVLSGCAAGARKSSEVLNTDLAIEKARLLGLFEHPPEQSLEVMNLDQTTPRGRAFAVLFRDLIWPHEAHAFTLQFKSSLLRLIEARAMLDGPAEQAAWEARRKALDDELRTINAEPAWREARQKWAAMGVDLGGELVAHARKLLAAAKDDDATPELKVIQDGMNTALGRIQKADNESPFNLTYGAATKAGMEVRHRWNQGKLDLKTATHELEELQKKGFFAMGQDLVEKTSGDINELAVLRSRYTRAKGYSSWASYQVGEKAKGYDGEFRTVAGRVSFLKKLLKSTRKPYADVLRQRFGGQSLHAAALRLAAIEPAVSLDAYFPVARAEQRWREMVRGSGFDERVLAEIHLDTQPRKNKYASAMAWPVAHRRPKILRIDARTLNLVMPDWRAQAEWLPAEIHLISNLAYDGIGPQLTLFHEGGHALDHASREVHFEIDTTETTTAYNETPSTMFENNYLTDPDTLRAIGMPEAAVAERIRSKSEFNALIEERMLAAECLIELLLWDYDYSKAHAQTFVSRTLDLYAQIMGRELGITYGITAGGLDPRMLAFASSRYYMGKVRYVDYILASRSAKLTAEALKDKLFKTSGRRSLYGQPKLGPTLVEELLRHGFSREFPRAIEEFSGRRFGR